MPNVNPQTVRVQNLQPQILEAYSNGMSIHKISELLEVSPSTVRKVLLVNQVSIRPPGRPRKNSNGVL